jgi:hypothetical protein
MTKNEQNRIVAWRLKLLRDVMRHNRLPKPGWRDKRPFLLVRLRAHIETAIGSLESNHPADALRTLRAALKKPPPDPPLPRTDSGRKRSMTTAGRRW